MAFFKFSKNVCLGALLGFGLIGTAQAYDDEDVLGQFLEQKLSVQQPVQNQAYNAPHYYNDNNYNDDPLAAYM